MLPIVKKSKFNYLLILYFSLFIFNGSHAATNLTAPPLIEVNAKSYILIDHASKKILAAKNITKRLEPASMTKVMTAYAALKEMQIAQLSNYIVISERAYRAVGSRTFLEINSRVEFDTLMHGLMVQSGNDAAIAIAEHIAGDEENFTLRMNQYTKEINLKNTNYINSTGLPHKNHYTSAEDLAKLTSQFITEFPDYYKYYSLKSFTYNGITQRNRNRLLWRDPTVDGIKTGHTESAGYCLVASAKRGNMRLISVIMGTTSDQQRTLQSQKLLNYGFRYFKTKKLLSAENRIENSTIWFGEKDNIPIGVNEDWAVTAPRRYIKKLTFKLNYPKNKLEAPIDAGQRIGFAIAEIDGNEISRIPLITLSKVAESDFINRLIDRINLFLTNLKEVIFG